MQKIEIWLKNEKRKFYNTFSWIIVVINILAFIYLALFSDYKQFRIASIATLILLAICSIVKFYKPKWQIGFYLFFLFCWVGWLSMQLYWLAGVVLIFDLLRSLAMLKTVALFYESSIIYPSFPVKNIRWSDLNNVILKDGLLTIDFKNNKIIQQLIDQNKTSINEQEFNEFCKQQLNK